MRMKSKKMMKNQSAVGWEDLHEDILLTVLRRLDHKSLLRTAYSVCRSWQSPCWEILFWREGGIIDLVILKNIFSFTPSLQSPMCTSRRATLSHQNSCIPHKNYEGHMMMKLLKKIFEGLREKLGSATRLIFPAHLNLSEDHLLYTAKRLPKLRQICLPCATHMITGVGFSRAIQHWSELRELSIGPIYISEYAHITQELGINCMNLEKLCIYTMDMKHGRTGWNTFALDEYTSSVIANSLGKLKTLVLDRCVLYKLGLKNIMTKCKGLQISLSACKIVSGDHINTLMRPGFVTALIKEEITSQGNTSIWSASAKNERYEFNSFMSMLDKMYQSFEIRANVSELSSQGMAITQRDEEALENMRTDAYCGP